MPTPALPPPQVDPIPADQDLLIQRLMGTICPPKPVAQEQSAVTELETMLLNWLPVGTVMEENAASPNPSTISAEGCFSCGILTHTTADCRTLDESFQFLPTGWQAKRIGDQFICDRDLQPGPADGKRRLIRREGLVAWISNDYRPLLLGRTFQDRRSHVVWGLPGC